jgi:hypothetical protein
VHVKGIDNFFTNIMSINQVAFHSEQLHQIIKPTDILVASMILIWIPRLSKI